MIVRRALLVACVVLATACGAAPGPDPTFPPDTAPGSTTPPVVLPPPEASVDWSDPAVVVELSHGWAVQKCEGDAPLLCVTRDSEHVGLVEANTYPRASYDVAGEDPLDVLTAIAAEFVADLSADREAGCGREYIFEPHPTEEVVVAGLPGLAFGFTGTLEDGTPSEHIRQFGTIVADDVVLFTAAAYDDGGCPGRDELTNFTTDDLVAFEQGLVALVAATPPPPS